MALLSWVAQRFQVVTSLTHPEIEITTVEIVIVTTDLEWTSLLILIH